MITNYQAHSPLILELLKAFKTCLYIYNSFIDYVPSQLSIFYTLLNNSFYIFLFIVSFLQNNSLSGSIPDLSNVRALVNL